MALTIFTDCSGHALTLTVQIGLCTTTSGYATFNTAVFNTATWGPDEVWTDVSAYVRKITTSRQFDQNFRSWTAGTFTVRLSNTDGRFSPDNLTGPFAPGGITQIIPGRPVKITLAYAGTVYPVIFGYANVWTEGWENTYGPRTGDAYMEISGSDEWQRISRPTGMATASAGAGETFGPRLQRILSYIGFTRTTDIDVGTIPLQATDLSTKPVEEIATTAASEGGSVWVGADGTLIGRRRYALVEDPRSVNIQAVYGDGGAGEIPWEDIDVSPLSADNVINSATYTAVGGLPQSAQDASSIALYGEIGDQASWSSSLICQNDSDVAVLAAWTVQLNKDPTAKVNSITLKPRASAVALIPTILGATIRDLIEIRRRPPSATSHTLIRDCFISGIAVTVESGDIDVVLSLSPASIYRIYAGSHFDSALFGASDIDPAGARFFI